MWPVQLHSDTDHAQVQSCHWSEGANGQLPGLELETLGVDRVIGEAVSVMMIHQPSLEVWLLKDDPSSIDDRVATGLLLEIIQFKVCTLVEYVDSIAI